MRGPGSVRVFEGGKSPAAGKAGRRRPTQSRARATADAIRQAFIQLLVENGYDKVTIRQVINLAGVGIGSFYEYFPSKEGLAAVCVHLRVKAITASMRQCIDATRDEPLPDRVDALLLAQTAAPLAAPAEWAALFLVERQVSGIEAYRRLYGEFVQLWSDALTTGNGWPAGASATEAAFVAHAVTYGLVSQTLMTAPEAKPDPATMRRLLRNAVHGHQIGRASCRERV